MPALPRMSRAVYWVALAAPKKVAQRIVFAVMEMGRSIWAKEIM